MRRAIGIDVGGTTTKIGVVPENGRLELARTLPTPHDPDTLCDLIAHEIHSSLLPAAGLDPDTPVGVTVPGILAEGTETVEAAVNLGWENLPLGRMLRHRTHAPMAFGHDVRAGALAEATWGAGRQLSTPSLIFVPVGTGIAAAIVKDGVPTGDRYAGEIGQIAVTDPDTGARARLETVASASAIARRYRDRARSVTMPGDVVEGRSSADATARDIVDRARTGEWAAHDVVLTAMDALAQALATVVSAVGPLPIVIGGGLAEGGDAVLDPLRERVSSHLGVIPAPSIVRSGLGPWAGCLGAGLLGLTRARRHSRMATT